jgi:hypothetical protein
MTGLGLSLLVIGCACAILALVRTFREWMPRLEKGISDVLDRSRWGILAGLLLRSWFVAFAFISMGLKVLGIIPTWVGALAFCALGVVVPFAVWMWRSKWKMRSLEALRANRARIRIDLAEARTFLPAEGEGKVQEHLTLFDKWMVSGELESAFDELEAAGGALACPPEFWMVLRGAAEKLGLVEEAVRIDHRLNGQD